MTKFKERPPREDLVAQACLEAYGAIRHDNRLSDRAIDFVLRNKKHLYSNERRAVAERVYALLRRQLLVDYLAERAFGGFEKLGTTRKDVFRLAVSRVLEGEPAVEVAVSLGLTGDESRSLERAPASRGGLDRLSVVERLSISTSVPTLFASKLIAQLGDEAPVAAEAMNTRAPLFARVNTLKLTREALLEQLNAEGVQARPTALSPFGLVIETRINVYSLKPFREGLFEIQDEGSQLLGMLVDAPPRKVIDACAGAGGKTLQLAAQMKNRGDLFALDVDARRLEDLRLRARRAGAHNVRVMPLPPAGPELDAMLEKLGGVERVLVDAPCSGSGTYRRKPDARYKLDEALLADYVRIQRELLTRFAPLVKPGGRLIYGTCSVLREENEDVVEAFLKERPDFTLTPAGTWLGDAASKCTEGGMLRLYPHRHGTDGFFGAVLTRTKA